MAWLLCITCILLTCPELLQGKASEYQLESETLSQCELLRAAAVGRQQGHVPHCTEDGRFRPVQCSVGGRECWCVDAGGQEVDGTRTNSSAPSCPSPCQLQTLLHCTASGLFESVQCDSSSGQCWCVDQDGMELYGTRQTGRAQRCPGSCEVRSRRLLHSSGFPSPPQCAADGSFLPVQCKFISTTNRTELDLLYAFNRFPEAFQTFGSFRMMFPMVSSYCFCADSRGRELQNTGVELLLSEVYDSVFSGLPSGRSFSQTNVYRVLQRRMLGVRLALNGHFRCPSPCEEERRAATEASSFYIPSCETSGYFSSRQCQQDGRCWCVDPTGAEVPGTRQQGDSLVCSPGLGDCLSQRRLALSRLFSGPAGPLLFEGSSGRSYSCKVLVGPLRDLFPVAADAASFLSRLVEVLQGLFPSVEAALQVLSRSSRLRFQEELFGGKFLKNTAAFNFSGTVGSQGALGLDQLSSQSAATGLHKYQGLVQSVSRILEDPSFLSGLQYTLTSQSRSRSASLEQVLTPLLRSCSGDEEDDAAGIYIPSCTANGGFQEVQCQGGECWCADHQGQEVTGSRTAGRRPRCPTRCETDRAMALKVKAGLAAGAEVHIPACSEDGAFLPLQCIGSRCFCVDAEGNTMTAGPAGGAVFCPERTTLKVQSSTGRCAQALAEVTAFRQEVQRIIALSNSSHLPVGYGFMLAEGVRLTPEELQTGRSEEERRVSEALLSASKAALRLAAYSTVQMLVPPQHRSYLPFTPQCDAYGDWLPTQCYHSTGQCWCVDEDGEYVPNSLSSRSLSQPQCLTRCQRAQAHTLLSGWAKGSDITTSLFQLKCDEDGRFSVLQTGGAAGWCVNPVTGETIQTASQRAPGQLTCPSWCELQGLQCRPDGSFGPLQCDVTSCWCVSEDGQEEGGTRMLRQTGQTPSCDRPLCPHPIVTHGALVCRPVADGRQSCDLVCYHGYQNALPVSSFICQTESLQWNNDDKPLSGACQMSQPLQSVSVSQLWTLSSACSQISSLQSLLYTALISRGLCSAQLSTSGRSVSLCDHSSVGLQCDGDDSLLTLRWTVYLSDIPTSDLPDLHDISLFLNESRLLEDVQKLLISIRSMPEFKLVSMTTPNFNCSPGFHLSSDGQGCVVCPAGSYFREGGCLVCPEGTYQSEEGRDFCSRCPRGSSPVGASSVYQCVTECERQRLQCSEQGDFRPAQPDFLSNRWRCVNSEGEELEWTYSNKPWTDHECSVLSRFETVPGSDLFRAEDAEVLQSMTSDLPTCVQACAVNPSCHHVALFSRQTQCELYSTHTLNTHCNTSQQSRGFLGNPQAEYFEWVSCSVGVRGGPSDLLVVRKKGAEFSSLQLQSFVRMKMMKAISGVFRTQVFSTGQTSLSDAHRFCQDSCSRDTCCDGFVLNQNSLSGGSVFCGWLRAPSVLMCGDQDWDVIGQGAANRTCGPGLTYNEQHKSFVFDFGGQNFTIAESALPPDSKTKSDYQASIMSFQAVYMDTDAGSTFGGSSSSCAVAEPGPPLDVSVQQRFQPLVEDDILVNPQAKLPVLSFWLNKQNYNSQQALLWCLTRCDVEQHCYVADLTDADSAGFFSCSLYPNSRVCGGYDKRLRRACPLLLHRAPSSTYSKKVDLSGPVKNFYERVSFQKMVSYSVRSRVSLRENTRLSDWFMACERRCDEDPCCRGIGFIRDSKSPAGSESVCLSLISLGVQTCSEEDVTTWRTQDCTPSVLKTAPEPLGWYQKPVNQWSSSPALCPLFNLPPTKTNVSVDEWHRLSDSSVLVDPSVSMYDVIHVSSDIATDPKKTRDWCLHACQEAESCAAVSLSEAESATRCVFYPDTTVCGLSSAPSSSATASSCRLVIREPASQVYLRTERLPVVTNISIEGHGVLQGGTVETVLGSYRRTVVQFLGVPYARPPIGTLRFEQAQPADWTGTWDATKPRPSCIQPGDAESAASSEDCLYLNVFSPAAQRGRVPVLVFFVNPSANNSPGLLDGSTLAAMGSIVVVTANYRTAALGFLSTGESGLRGNYGLSDQEAVLRWVNAHISQVGGDNRRVTVGSERRGADITSLHLLSSSSPLFHRIILMGGSVFSPSLLQTPAASRRQTVDLAKELGCVTSDLTDETMVGCLKATPVHTLNAAQTKLLAVSGPFQSWAPVRQSASLSSFHRVDLLLGTSEHDGLISRARRIKDFEALQGRADGKTAFYEALSRSLGGVKDNALLKEAAAWFYSLDHSPSPAGYNLFSRALNNATRDLFIICPSLQMARHWANSQANVFLYHQPTSSTYDRSDPFVPLDVQLVFGTPHHPQSLQRFTTSDRRLSLAMMTYVSSFIQNGNPNPSRVWPGSVLPRWQPVLPSETLPTYLQLSPSLLQQNGLGQNTCSFWTQLGARLRSQTDESDHLVSIPELPLAAAPGQSQTEGDAYS